MRRFQLGLLLLVATACQRSGTDEGTGPAEGTGTLGVEAEPAPRPSPANALRNDDLDTNSIAERVDIDRRARQLVSDTSRDPMAREVACDELEAMYWHRFEAADGMAHRLEALSKHGQICGRPAARGRSLEALRGAIAGALESGATDDAVTAIRALLALEGELPGPSAEEAVQARATLHELLWPTFRERRRQRFDDRMAEAWAGEGSWEPESATLSTEIRVALGPGCTVETCEAPAHAAAHVALTALAREVGELTEGAADPGPCLEIGGLDLVNGGEAELVFRAWAPLDEVIRALYDCAR